MLKHLKLVELELFSYCNRQCNWCPNREIDRHSECIEMEDEIFFKVLNDLKAFDFTGAITFSRYNEPMSQIDIFKKRITQIKEILPDNKLISNTNGDFITKENLDDLLLDELTIMDYDAVGMGKCVDKLINAGANIDKYDYPYIHAHKDKMKILYYVDWTLNAFITNRGSTLYNSEKRTDKCYEPDCFLGINYDGTVSPCCDIRNDIDSMKPYIMGDLHNQSLYSITNTTKYILFRNHCLFGQFEENSPCEYCTNRGGRFSRGKGGINYE